MVVVVTGMPLRHSVRGAELLAGAPDDVMQQLGIDRRG
jgi:hypothetical protein